MHLFLKFKDIISNRSSTIISLTLITKTQPFITPPADLTSNRCIIVFICRYHKSCTHFIWIRRSHFNVSHQQRNCVQHTFLAVVVLQVKVVKYGLRFPLGDHLLCWYITRVKVPSSETKSRFDTAPQSGAQMKLDRPQFRNINKRSI